MVRRLPVSVNEIVFWGGWRAVLEPKLLYQLLHQSWDGPDTRFHGILLRTHVGEARRQKRRDIEGKIVRVC